MTISEPVQEDILKYVVIGESLESASEVVHTYKKRFEHINVEEEDL
jgi:hypothetical protein